MVFLSVNIGRGAIRVVNMRDDARHFIFKIQKRKIWRPIV